MNKLRKLLGYLESLAVQWLPFLWQTLEWPSLSVIAAKLLKHVQGGHKTFWSPHVVIGQMEKHQQSKFCVILCCTISVSAERLNQARLVRKYRQVFSHRALFPRDNSEAFPESLYRGHTGQREQGDVHPTLKNAGKASIRLGRKKIPSAKNQCKALWSSGLHDTIFLFGTDSKIKQCGGCTKRHSMYQKGMLTQKQMPHD